MITEKCEVVLFGESLREKSRPIGVYVLASYLRAHSIPTQAIWGWNQISYPIFNALCKKFLNDQIKVIGISSTFLAYIDPNIKDFFGLPQEELYKRFNLIKKLAPNAKIIVGGSQVNPKDLHNIKGAEFVDLFVKGQGEQVLLEFVNSVKNNTRVATTVITPPMTSDQVYEFKNFAHTQVKFDTSDGLLPGESMAIELARGCIFKCSFCGFHLNGKSPGDFVKSKKTLTQELMYNYENFGTTHYYVSDDLINDSEEKVDMLLEVSSSLPFKLTYGGYLRLDLIRRFPSMAVKLKQAGLISCFFGIETVNDESGRAVGKGLGIERTTEAIEICNQAWNNSVFSVGGFILGLPKDTPDTKYQLSEWCNLPQTRRVIKEIKVKPLFIGTLNDSIIGENPGRFGYREIEKDLKNPNMMNWVNDRYSYKQAAFDGKWVEQEFAKSLNFKCPKHAFSLPYYLAMSEHPQEILNVCLKDQSTIWANDKEYREYITSLCKNHRKNYYKLLLTDR